MRKSEIEKFHSIRPAIVIVIPFPSRIVYFAYQFREVLVIMRVIIREMENLSRQHYNKDRGGDWRHLNNFISITITRYCAVRSSEAAM